ncbi:MAG: ribonuclease III [Verrucomicrobia bacterium]|nr:ribonuclease III [Verrucomicrobiota bacterium]
MPDLGELQSRLGFTFKAEDLLRLALTHPSVAHEQGVTVQHNQRLEFLGDAVLQLVLTRVLYEKFPDFGEGPLTKARAQLVNRRALAEHGRVLGLGEHLVLSRGEELNQGRSRPSTLADAYEALLGAIFLDSGFEAAEGFILRQFHEVLGSLETLPILENPKGELQEVLQSRSPEAPRYVLMSVSGPDHDRDFECAVYYRKVELGRGSGKSKKEAECRAALNALAALREQAQESAQESEAGHHP